MIILIYYLISTFLFICYEKQYVIWLIFKVSFNGEFERTAPNILVPSISWSIEEHNQGFEWGCEDQNYENKVIEEDIEEKTVTIPVINPTPDCDSVFKEYECPVCLTVMKPPIHIYQCTSGHNICSNCKSKGIKGCPTCRKPISGRAHNMENIAKLIFLLECDPSCNCDKKWNSILYNII